MIWKQRFQAAINSRLITETLLGMGLGMIQGFLFSCLLLGLFILIYGPGTQLGPGTGPVLMWACGLYKAAWSFSGRLSDYRSALKYLRGTVQEI
jgi:hypothetical protein